MMSNHTEVFYSPAELANKAFFLAYGVPIQQRYYDDDRDGDTEASCKEAMETFLETYCKRLKKTRAKALHELKALCSPQYRN